MDLHLLQSVHTQKEKLYIAELNPHLGKSYMLLNFIILLFIIKAV